MTTSLTSDVLVVGGGLAALRAALAAAMAGADVTLAVKGKAGRSGCSAMTSAGYTAALDPADSPERHRAETLASADGMAGPALVEILAAEAPARLRELIELGAAFECTEDGQLRLHPSGDHTAPRIAGTRNAIGTDITLPLADRVRAAGVRVLEHVAIAEVVTVAGRVAGAIGIGHGTPEGEVVAIRAPAVILAAGGAGRLYRVTSNPRDVVGDGYALGLRAGALLRDMEFVQFYPWRCLHPLEHSHLQIQPSTFVRGGRLRNAAGARFMPGVDPVREEATTRAIAARGIWAEIAAGRDVRGGVVLDTGGMSDADWEFTNRRLARHFREKRIDRRTAEIIVTPEAHYCMGGLEIDASAMTRVPGLFAAGENAGGI